MRRAMLVAALLALCGCGKSFKTALDECTLQVARTFPNADFEVTRQLIDLCMTEEGYPRTGS